MKRTIIKIIFAVVLYYVASLNHTYSQTSQSPDREIYKDFVIEDVIPETSGVTSINFVINKPGKVNLSVYDADGKLIETLVDGDIDSGKYCVHFKPSEFMKAGKYNYKIQSADAEELKELKLHK